MKVLQINVVCGNGSTGKIAVDIANMLKSKGDEAYIAYGFGQTDYKESFKITSDNEYRLNVHLFAKLGLHNRGSRYGTRKLLEWIDKIAPDIIHLHNIHGMYVHYPMLFEYIKKHNISVVWTLHDCWSFTGSCAHFSSVGCEKWITECSHCTYNGTYKEKSWIDNSRSTFYLKKNLFTGINNMLLVPVSHWLGDLVKESFLKDVPQRVINNGIDLNIFKPTPSNLKTRLGIPDDMPVVLGVSSGWSDSKGLSEFVRLSQDGTYKVILIGVQEGLMGSLPSNIIAIKRTQDQTELAQYYSMADVFVNPTYNDTFPTVNIEALACGTPVVTYDTDGSGEIVNDINTGEVIEQGSFTQLKSAIASVLSKGRESFSSECVKRAQERFDKRDRYLDYYEIYSGLMKKNSR